MTTDELNALPPGTLIYLPTEWEVMIWIWAGQVPNRNFYTLLHPPDPDGKVTDRRPRYADVGDLLPATLDEQAAWLAVVAGLNERIKWIYKRKLTDGTHDHNEQSTLST